MDYISEEIETDNMSDDDDDYDLDTTFTPTLWRVLIIGGLIAWSILCGAIVGLSGLLN